MTFYSLIGIVVTSATVVIFGEPVWDPVQVIARSLKPGGRFVTVNTNPSLAFPSAPCYRKYGFQTEAVGEWGEGPPIRWTFHLGDGSFTIENYHLSVASHEEALRRAWFRDIRWHPAAGGMRADPRASRAPCVGRLGHPRCEG